MARFVITHAESGKKLARFLRQWLPDVPLSAIYQGIRTGRVRVNGERGTLKTVLHEGDAVEWAQHLTCKRGTEPAQKPGVAPPRARPLIDVVYEDADILVLNKPEGLLTHSDRRGEQDTLVDRALRYLAARGEALSPVVRPAAVNRLDRNTTGLVLIGKNGPALRRLSEWIRGHMVKKEYLTVVEGQPPKEGELRGVLIRSSRTRRTRIAHPAEPGGQVALTRFRTIATKNGYSLLAVEIVTGRTHQIRAQLAAAGHPLLGDTKYGGHPAFGRHRPLLHAWRLTLPDGRTFTAPLPAPFEEVLKRTGHKTLPEALG